MQVKILLLFCVPCSDIDSVVRAGSDVPTVVLRGDNLPLGIRVAEEACSLDCASFSSRILSSICNNAAAICSAVPLIIILLSASIEY